MKTRSQRVGGLAALLTASAFALTGCEDNADTIFLYIINGYPASTGMTIQGPTGIIVQDAQFGDRIGQDGPCPAEGGCVPLEIDRQFGTEWTILMEGMEEPADVDQDLFAMYPQETGTFIVTRRSAVDSIQTSLFRHVQTISTSCGLTMANGLSLSNENMTLNTYDIGPEFRIDAPEDAGYADETTVPFLTECGPLPIDAPEHAALARADLYSQVQASPWFYPTDCDDQTFASQFCYTWGIPGLDGRSSLSDQGEVLTFLPTIEYYDCVQSAIEIKQEEDPMNPSPFPIPADAQVTCPEEPLDWSHVQVDFAAAQACRNPVLRTAFTLEPAANDTTLSFWNYFDQSFCDIEFRVRNHGQDIVFGPQGSDSHGEHQDGDIITTKVNADAGSEHFWVILGRPVNPIIWQWDSGENFVKLHGDAGFPYPNEQDSRIGEYDD